MFTITVTVYIIPIGTFESELEAVSVTVSESRKSETGKVLLFWDSLLNFNIEIESRNKKHFSC